jgi:hypothetical protein
MTRILWAEGGFSAFFRLTAAAGVEHGQEFMVKIEAFAIV